MNSIFIRFISWCSPKTISRSTAVNPLQHSGAVPRYDPGSVLGRKPEPPYPSVTVRMDFRGPDTGDFVYHCHILGHEDNGMMAVIRVIPAVASEDRSSPLALVGSNWVNISSTQPREFQTASPSHPRGGSTLGQMSAQ